jgi:hypothetical protein
MYKGVLTTQRVHFLILLGIKTIKLLNTWYSSIWNSHAASVTFEASPFYFFMG